MLVVILSDITSYTYLLLNISRMTGMMKVNIFVTGCMRPPEKIILWKISKWGEDVIFNPKKYVISIREQPDYISGLFSVF